MKGVIVDCKTGNIRYVEDEVPFPKYPSYEEPKGLNFEKLKVILRKQSIIKDESEIQ